MDALLKGFLIVGRFKRDPCMHETEGCLRKGRLDCSYRLDVSGKLGNPLSKELRNLNIELTFSRENGSFSTFNGKRTRATLSADAHGLVKL